MQESAAPMDEEMATEEELPSEEVPSPAQSGSGLMSRGV
jgi:hypothetical protein